MRMLRLCLRLQHRRRLSSCWSSSSSSPLSSLPPSPSSRFSSSSSSSSSPSPPSSSSSSIHRLLGWDASSPLLPRIRVLSSGEWSGSPLPDAVVVPVHPQSPQLPVRLQQYVPDSLSTLNPTVLASLAASNTPIIAFSSSTRLVLTPFPPSDDQTTAVDLQVAVHRGLNAVRGMASKNIAIAMPDDISEDGFASLVRGIVLSSHRFQRHLSKPASSVESVDLLHLGGADAAASDERLQKLGKQLNAQLSRAEATVVAREIVNERADVVTPAFVEEAAQRLAEEASSVSVEVICGAEALKENQCEMLAAVGQAATQPPRLVLLKLNEDADEDEHGPAIALVGKGVTFDTGGLNLKPTGSIETMHMDMGGAAAVLAAMRTLAKTPSLKRKVIAVLALAENAINEKAVKPHAILQSCKGSVQVSNTDAEGRLCLADALSYVQRQYSPSHVVDVATLTGACVVALGEYTAGLFSNDDAMAADLIAAGDATFERCWRLPILPEHTAELKGTQTDLLSCGKGRYGGASTAAAFLQKFVEKDTSWAHLDIAGPAMYSSERDFMPEGGTGFGAQLLAEYVLKQCSDAS